MQEINVSDFRQKCLSLLDDLPSEGILVTKHGRPVATITPVQRPSANLIGSIPDLLLDSKDNLLDTGIQWNAQS